MDPKSVSKLSNQIAKKFPELAGARPSIRRDPAAKKGEERFLLTYKGKAVLPGGRTMKRIVRVVADPRGRILKLSTSK